MVCFHNPEDENGYLSNWYHSQFFVNGVEYSSLEQYMMHQKAVRFDDEKIASEILATDDVAAIKALGRQVSGYDGSYWNGVRQIVVFEGLMAKFEQNPELRKKLLATGDDILVECAAKDPIWACGKGIHDPERFDKSRWKGQNLLGYALMMVRENLRK